MSKLFETASINKMTLKNLFVRSSTWEGMADGNGEVTELLIDLYRDLARGGVGLILTGGAFITKRGQIGLGMLGAHDDALIPGLKSLAGAVHKEGGRVALQIVHGGSQGNFDTGMPTEAPSAVKERSTENMPVEMTAKDIKRVIKEFVEAAGRAKEAGFDGVEIHAAHGYLLSQFLSPYSNRRTDQYGGPIKNRARIILEKFIRNI